MNPQNTPEITPSNDPDDAPFAAPVQIPIDGVLDLHSFRPQDVRDVVEAYLEACRSRGILEVRVIHGKGIGQLRQTVHAFLRRHPGVVSFDLAGPAWGGEGATIVHVRPSTTNPAGTGA